jgi:AbrB family looped-hinge helix DNA binding protein
MLKQLSVRGTITIPKKILTDVGAGAGDYLEITDDGKRIILTPRVIEERYSDEEWRNLESLAKKRGKVFAKGSEAKEHIKRLAK